MCDHIIVIIPGHTICSECGLYISPIMNETSRHHPIGEPLVKKIYTHQTRFNKLLKRLLMLSSPPPKKVFIYLEKK